MNKVYIDKMAKHRNEITQEVEKMETINQILEKDSLNKKYDFKPRFKKQDTK